MYNFNLKFSYEFFYKKIFLRLVSQIWILKFFLFLLLICLYIIHSLVLYANEFDDDGAVYYLSIKDVDSMCQYFDLMYPDWCGLLSEDELGFLLNYPTNQTLYFYWATNSPFLKSKNDIYPTIKTLLLHYDSYYQPNRRIGWAYASLTTPSNTREWFCFFNQLFYSAEVKLWSDVYNVMQARAGSKSFIKVIEIMRLKHFEIVDKITEILKPPKEPRRWLSRGEGYERYENSKLFAREEYLRRNPNRSYRPKINEFNYRRYILKVPKIRPTPPIDMRRPRTLPISINFYKHSFNRGFKN